MNGKDSINIAIGYFQALKKDEYNSFYSAIIPALRSTLKSLDIVERAGGYEAIEDKMISKASVISADDIPDPGPPSENIILVAKEGMKKKQKDAGLEEIVSICAGHEKEKKQ